MIGHWACATIKDADEIFDTVDEIVAKNPTVLWPAAKGPTPTDARVTAYVSIEGAGPFAEDITQIDRFIARGVVLVGPVHSHDSKLATSATGADKKSGLSELGKKFCERVYRAGALVDVSHMSDRSFEDLIPIAKSFDAPIVATHSNARALADHPRNLTDDELRVIAETGGVAGLNFHHDFVIDHVAIGSDFDGGTPPEDLADVSYLPKLAADLRAAGLSEADVHKIFSENAKRVLGWTDRARARAARRE